MNRNLVIFLVIISLLGFSSILYAQDSGQLALVGSDGNIYTYDLATDTLGAVTTDATLQEPARFYTWPTWSSDGQLAFFGTSLDPDNFFNLGVFVQQVGKEPKGVFSAEDEFFTYAYWSPADCPAGNCRDLALLYSTPQGLATRLVRSADTFSIIEISQGGPFYWDWSPDGGRMFWARFGQRLELFDVASAAVVSVLPENQGQEQAVDWSPVDDRLLAAVATPDGNSLVVIDGERRVVLGAGFQRGVAYEWSPDGAQVALLDRASGQLSIVSAADGSLNHAVSDQVLAFFWSPDGEKLAFITFAEIKPSAKFWQQASLALQWQVYDSQRDTIRSLSAFVPTDSMIYYLSYFDQFSRSHRLWSPDSRYLVYGEVQSNGNNVVSLHAIDAPRSQTVAAGVVGVFSW